VRRQLKFKKLTTKLGITIHKLTTKQVNSTKFFLLKIFKNLFLKKMLIKVRLIKMTKS